MTYMKRMRTLLWACMLLLVCGPLSTTTVSGWSMPGNRIRRRFPTKSRHAYNGRSAIYSSSATSHDEPPPPPANESFWRWDELDQRLLRISLPVIANFAIAPIIGAVDLFWVNRMGNALAVAGQAAANQVFSSAFWFISFLPSVTATLVSKQYAEKNTQGTQDAVCQALFLGSLIAGAATILMMLYPQQALSSVLPAGAPALAFARPYLLIRSISFVPSLISLVGFSAFRGILETKTPVKISSFANLINAILDPILIFAWSLGVPGAAWATLVAEMVSAAIYLKMLRNRQLIPNSVRKIFALPSWKSLAPLLKGGAALQVRNVALNLTFLRVAHVTQSLDASGGIAAAAHAVAIQTFQLGGIVLLALSTVAQTVVPRAMVLDETKTSGNGSSDSSARRTVRRLMQWGLVLGSGLAALQLAVVPAVTKTSPLLEVRQAAKLPARIGSLLQIINGCVFIGEGVMIGTGSFWHLSLWTSGATAVFVVALQIFSQHWGLAGVWAAFGVWNVVRLLGVIVHQGWTGPLAPRRQKQAAASS